MLEVKKYLSINDLANIMNRGSFDIDLIQKIKSLAHAIFSTQTYFVSAAGDNSDGSSWERAYTSLPTCLNFIEANQSTGEIALVMLSVGTFDINITLNPTYSANIILFGAGRDFTKITNTHTTATAVLKFTGLTGIHNLKVDTGASTIDGILINGTSSKGFEASNVYFEGDSATGAHDLLLIDGSTEYCKIFDCRFHGAVGSTTGLRFNGASYNLINNCEFDDCLVAIHLDNATDDDNQFYNCSINYSATGILIDAGTTKNSFNAIIFHGNTLNVSDASINTLFTDIEQDGEANVLLPDTASTGITIVSLNVADSYAVNYTEIDSGATFTKPFKVVGAFLGNPSDNTATHVIKIATGAAAAEVDFGHLVYESTKKTGGGTVPFNTGWLPAGTRISANVQTENAVADTIDIWILYKEM